LEYLDACASDALVTVPQLSSAYAANCHAVWQDPHGDSAMKPAMPAKPEWPNLAATLSLGGRTEFAGAR
jgi:hypothetical protein